MFYKLYNNLIKDILYTTAAIYFASHLLFVYLICLLLSFHFSSLIFSFCLRNIDNILSSSLSNYSEYSLFTSLSYIISQPRKSIIRHSAFFHIMFYIMYTTVRYTFYVISVSPLSNSYCFPLDFNILISPVLLFLHPFSLLYHFPLGILAFLVLSVSLIIF